MSNTKTQLLDAIEAIPREEFNDIDDVLNEIIIIAKIEKGLLDMEEGRLIEEEEIDKMIEQW